MREIKKLDEQDLLAFAQIVVNAYPAFHTSVDETGKRLLKVHREDDSIEFYGLFENGSLLGGMRFHHYLMNLYGMMIPVAGVGLVAVDLLHKKEKVAKDLISYFIDHFKEKGVHFLSLYPFRQDFYKHMGFGIANKMHQYRVVPTSLPKGMSKAHIRYLTSEDKELLRDCHQRYVTTTHGMFHKTEMELNGIFENPNLRVIGFVQEGQIKGYISFAFKRVSEESFLKNNLHVIELIYDNREVLSELLTFLNSQADQIDRIIINTQDEYFHHLFMDPRNGTDRLIPPVFHESNTSGIGLMYRVIDVKEAFFAMSHRNFRGQTLRVKITVLDSFYTQNQGSTIVHFENGSPKLSSSNEYDVEITLDISDFSSMIMGVIPFRQLYRYGLVEISDPLYLNQLEMLFLTNEKPICMSGF